MLGALAGDIVGSCWEGGRCESKEEFNLFGSYNTITDDSICTIAVADALLNEKDIANTLAEYVKGYPDMGYGRWFKTWALSGSLTPYDSYGNGSAMRVSSIGALANSEKSCLALATISSKVTHNHPEGIRGAQAVALSTYLAFNNYSAKVIKNRIEKEFGYKIYPIKDYINRPFNFDTAAVSTVPIAISCAVNSKSWEDCMLACVMCGGDSDTLCAMAGGISEYLHGLPSYANLEVIKHLDSKLLAIVNQFKDRALYDYKPRN